jgi:hypothetical protein
MERIILLVGGVCFVSIAYVALCKLNVSFSWLFIIVLLASNYLLYFHKQSHCIRIPIEVDVENRYKNCQELEVRFKTKGCFGVIQESISLNIKNINCQEIGAKTFLRQIGTEGSNDKGDK